jgi:putative DNA primase/helicase
LIWDTLDARLDEIRAMDRDGRNAALGELVRHPGYIGDIAAEAIDDPGALDVWLLRHKSLLGRDVIALIRKAVRAAVADLQRVRDQERERARNGPGGDNREPEPDLATALGRPDLPALAVPRGWLCSGAGIWRHIEAGENSDDVKVSHRPIVVTGVLRDLDSDSRTLVVEWATETDAWGRAIVPASETQDVRAFVRMRDLGAPVSARNARDLAEWLDDLEEANGDQVPRAWHASRLGWVGDGGRLGYLWGRTLLRADGDRSCDLPPAEWGADHVRLAIPENDGRAQLADGCHAAGTFEGWVAAIGHIAEHPRVMLGVYASLASAFLGIVTEAPNAIVDWNGETSRGKTTTLRAAASVWGRPETTGDGLMRTWDVSPAGLESLAETACHMPLILDDTKRATTRGGDGGIVSALIYQIAAGQGRGRGRPDGMRRTATWRLIMLSTGEAPATSFTQDAGARARVLSISGSPLPDGSETIVAAVTAGVCDNYGHAGPRLVRWLLANPTRWAGIRRHYTERVAFWAQETGSSPVAARLAQILALVELGAMALHRILGVPKPETDPMLTALDAAILSSEDADRPTAALRSVYSWAVQHAAEFWGRHECDREGNPRAPSRGWAGVWARGDDWREIAFVPAVLVRVLDYHGFRANDIIPRWIERGWLVSDGDHKGNPGPKRSINGNKDRACVILRGTFDGPSSGDVAGTSLRPTGTE